MYIPSFPTYLSVYIYILTKSEIISSCSRPAVGSNIVQITLATFFKTFLENGRRQPPPTIPGVGGSPGIGPPTRTGTHVPVPPVFEPIDLPVSPVSLFSSIPMSPSGVRPDFDGTREDQCSLSASSSHLPDSRLSPVSTAPPWSSSPIDSERSDESFHSATDSPVIRTPVPDPGSLFREGQFDAAAQHHRIGDQHGGCPYRVTSYRDYEHYI